MGVIRFSCSFIAAQKNCETQSACLQKWNSADRAELVAQDHHGNRKETDNNGGKYKMGQRL